MPGQNQRGAKETLKEKGRDTVTRQRAGTPRFCFIVVSVVRPALRYAIPHRGCDCAADRSFVRCIQFLIKTKHNNKKPRSRS